MEFQKMKKFSLFKIQSLTLGSAVFYHHHHRVEFPSRISKNWEKKSKEFLYSNNPSIFRCHRNSTGMKKKRINFLELRSWRKELFLGKTYIKSLTIWWHNLFEHPIMSWRIFFYFKKTKFISCFFFYWMRK